MLSNNRLQLTGRGFCNAAALVAASRRVAPTIAASHRAAVGVWSVHGGRQLSREPLDDRTRCESMGVLDGRWTGQIAGTNVGSFTLDLETEGDGLRGVFALDDLNLGKFVYDVSGESQQNQLTLELAPRAFPARAHVAAVTAAGAIQPDGSMSGTWRSEEVRTNGTFLAFKQSATASSASTATPIAISYQKRHGVIPCAVDSEVLLRIFRDLSAGSDEAARLLTGQQSLASALSGAGQAQTLAHHAQTRAAYSVTVTARSATGEQRMSLDSTLLEERNLPKPLQVVEFDIGSYYQWTTQRPAPNRARVVLDFTRPPPVDLSNPSAAPTPNNSYIEVVGNDSMWVSGVYEKLTSTLQQGRLRNGWLHSRYTYDVLLILLGFPGAVAVATLFGQWLSRRFFGNEGLPQVGGFLIALLASLLVFRLAFGAVRWLLPLVEYAPPVQPLHRQIRVALSVVLLGVISSLAATALWVVFASSR